MPALIVLSGPQQGERIEVIAELTIGRENQDVILGDPEVSRRHAVVRVSGAALELADVGSSNGTFVNGRRIEVPTLLADGDEVRMGRTVLRADLQVGGRTVVGEVPGTPPAPSAPPGPAASPAPAASPGPLTPPYVSEPDTVIPTGPPPAPLGQPPGSPPRRTGRVIAFVIGGLVLLAAIGAGAWFLLTRGPSKEDFIPQADSICAAKSQESDALELPTNLAETGPYFEQNTQILKDETAEVRALDTPDEDKATLDDWLQTQDELVTQFEALAEAANGGDQKSFDATFADTVTIQSRSSDLAERYGFKDCGKSSASASE